MLLSAVDLLITLTHLTTTGMMEANPVAAWLIRTTGSPSMLAIYKSLTVGIPIALLFRLRHKVQAEIGSWCGLAVLIGVSLAWHGYALEFESPLAVHLAQRGLPEDQWLVLD
ncbi:MAG: DUF5658 family protein [Planctomycetota bacterium]